MLSGFLLRLADKTDCPGSKKQVKRKGLTQNWLENWSHKAKENDGMLFPT